MSVELHHQHLGARLLQNRWVGGSCKALRGTPTPNRLSMQHCAVWPVLWLLACSFAMLMAQDARGVL